MSYTTLSEVHDFVYIYILPLIFTKTLKTVIATSETNCIEDLGWNRLGLYPSEMMDVKEDREVWRLNLDLPRPQPFRKSGQSRKNNINFGNNCIEYFEGRHEIAVNQQSKGKIYTECTTQAYTLKKNIQN